MARRPREVKPQRLVRGRERAMVRWQKPGRFMDRDEIRTRIALLLGDILDQPDLTLTDQTAAADVEGWDSLAHMKLLVAIEGEWGVSFQVSEMGAAESVGDLVDLVRAKLQA
jgi:acyl carrier protein